MRVLRRMVGSVLILSAMAGVAQAQGVGPGGNGPPGVGPGGNGPPGQNKKDAPEVDLGTAGGAPTLLVGGLLILKDRFRRQ
ncbi:MAG: hypothetical protein JO252_02910 [Planctomycetaceae bacterium]|nr:hypothetical protein [Planctomycetaceae bacterium]